MRLQCSIMPVQTTTLGGRWPCMYWLPTWTEYSIWRKSRNPVNLVTFSNVSPVYGIQRTDDLTRYYFALTLEEMITFQKPKLGYLAPAMNTRTTRIRVTCIITIQIHSDPNQQAHALKCYQDTLTFQFSFSQNILHLSVSLKCIQNSKWGLCTFTSIITECLTATQSCNSVLYVPYSTIHLAKEVQDRTENRMQRSLLVQWTV